jgi:hypothetical protein
MATQMTERYCPICGKLGQSEFNRFGEWACSETHAEEHVAEVRAQKQRLLTGGDRSPEPQRPERPRRQFCGG